MNKKECKKLINELLRELDNKVELDIEQLNKNNKNKDSTSIIYKFSYDIIKSHIETIRDKNIYNILNKIDNKIIDMKLKREKEIYENDKNIR